MASTISQTLPLEMMAAGERGTVIDVAGQPELVGRLAEMGLHSGVHLCMVRPGSPCIVEINQQRYSVRFEDYATVLVDIAP